MVRVEADALEGGLVTDEDDGDLAVFHLVLAADINDIAVEDAGVDHAVTTAAEGEVGVDVVGEIHVPLQILLRQDGFAAGDAAQQGDAAHGGHGDDIVG